MTALSSRAFGANPRALGTNPRALAQLAVMPEEAFYILMALREAAGEPCGSVRAPWHEIEWAAWRLMGSGPASRVSIDGRKRRRRSSLSPDRGLGWLMINQWVENIRHKPGSANTYRLLRPVPPVSVFGRLR